MTDTKPTAGATAGTTARRTSGIDAAWLALHREPILEPDLPIVDAHHHLLVRPGLRYLLDDYLTDAKAGHRIVASVLMEVLTFARRDGPELLRPLGEVEFANGCGAMCAGAICPSSP